MFFWWKVFLREELLRRWSYLILDYSKLKVFVLLEKNQMMEIKVGYIHNLKLYINCIYLINKGKTKS